MKNALVFVGVIVLVVIAGMYLFSFNAQDSMVPIKSPSGLRALIDARGSFIPSVSAPHETISSDNPDWVYYLTAGSSVGSVTSGLIFDVTPNSVMVMTPEKDWILVYSSMDIVEFPPLKTEMYVSEGQTLFELGGDKPALRFSAISVSDVCLQSQTEFCPIVSPSEFFNR